MKVPTLTHAAAALLALGALAAAPQVAAHSDGAEEGHHEEEGGGGDIGPSLNADEMPDPMNTFEFAARMWRGAPAMTDLQENLLGDAITLNGQELADIIAFAHDEQAQAQLSADQVPEKYREIAEGE